jgi:hypothetical protein
MLCRSVFGRRDCNMLGSGQRLQCTTLTALNTALTALPSIFTQFIVFFPHPPTTMLAGQAPAGQGGATGQVPVIVHMPETDRKHEVNHVTVALLTTRPTWT